MATINFSKIFHPLCSCGKELGFFQKDIENSLENGVNNIALFNSLGLKMCCRNNIITSCEYIITSIDNESFKDEIGIRSGNQNSNSILKNPIIERDLPSSHNPFPSLPILTVGQTENIINQPQLLKPGVLPIIIKKI
jgi:DNA-directed RNA polymerase subunit N (RpoN/RPB10)